MNRLLKILLPAALLPIMAGCAQQVTESSGEQAQEYLELIMKTDYPNLQPDKWGIYIIQDIPGTGAEWNKELPYSNLRSTYRSIGGTIISSTEESIAKQLDENSYKPYNYYGPKFQNTSEGKGNAGLEYLLEGMKVGGSRTAVIPSWLITTSRYSTKKQYLDACSSTTHMIYEITLEGQCKDVQEYEIEELRKYVSAHYGESEKSYIYKAGQKEGTFYFVSDSSSFKADEKRASDATLSLTYTGRRLDGKAFDTNSQEVAMKEGLFVKEKEYEKATIKFSSTYSSVSMNGSSSLVDGFKAGLYKMNWIGQKATVLFVSELGYSSSGSGDVIPPYAPLIFELELSE